MRHVLRVDYQRGSEKFPFGYWKVFFVDGSVVGVDISSAFTSPEKTMDRIEAAAVKYAKGHPDSVLSGTVVNLQAERVN